MKLPSENSLRPEPVNMLLKVFYRRVILTEETTVVFLREHNLLDIVQQADPYHKCSTDQFFHYTDVNKTLHCNLSLS